VQNPVGSGKIENFIRLVFAYPHPHPRLWTFQTASIASSSGKGGCSRLGVVKKVAAATEETMDEPLSLCQYRLRRIPTHAHGYGQNDHLISDYSPSTPSTSTSRIGDLPTPVQPYLLLIINRPLPPFSLLSITPTLIVRLLQLVPTKSKDGALSAAVRHRSCHLDKAVRHLLDGDAQPDRCAQWGVSQ
jgi:hypothetical protein